MRSAVRPRRPVVHVAGVVVTVAGLLSGCSGQSDDADPSPSASSSASASSTATDAATPTSSVTPTPTPTPSSSPSPSRPPGLAGRLLPAADVPELLRGVHWTVASTTPESPSSSFGTCQRFSTLAIGAEKALVRRYRPTRAIEVRAGELVAQLPDALTARRAYAVLTAWRGRCGDRLRRYTRPTVGALQDVAVPGGVAGWYLLGYGSVPGRPGIRSADAQGMVVVDNRLAMVSLRTTGSRAAVRTAMPTALRSAARLLQ